MGSQIPPGTRLFKWMFTCFTFSCLQVYLLKNLNKNNLKKHVCLNEFSSTYLIRFTLPEKNLARIYDWLVTLKIYQPHWLVIKNVHLDPWS